MLQDLVNPLEQILPCRRFLDESALSAVEHLTWDAIVGGTHPQDPDLRVDFMQERPDLVALQNGHVIVQQDE